MSTSLINLGPSPSPVTSNCSVAPTPRPCFSSVQTSCNEMLVTTIRKSSNAFGSSQSWIEQSSTCLEVDTMSPHKELVTLLLSKHAHVISLFSTSCRTLLRRQRTFSMHIEAGTCELDCLLCRREGRVESRRKWARIEALTSCAR